MVIEDSTVPSNSYKGMLCKTHFHTMKETQNFSHTLEPEEITPNQSRISIPILYSPWLISVIVKIYDKIVGFGFYLHVLKIFGMNEELHIIDLEKDYFLVKFKFRGNYLKALHDGPWFAGNHFLMV